MTESVSGQDGAKNPVFWLASQSEEMDWWAHLSRSKFPGWSRKKCSLYGHMISNLNNNNNNNNKLYLHDHIKILQYCKTYLQLIIDSL